MQKFLADSGLGSRRFCEELIINNKIKVNGSIAKIGCKVSLNDEVVFNGTIVSKQENEIQVLLFNKPDGAISSNARRQE